MVGYVQGLGQALGFNSDQTQGGLTGAFDLAGLGLTAFGVSGEVSAAKQEANISMQEAQTEMQQNEVRRTMMNVDTNRKLIQAQRNAEQARAVGKSAAVNQGGTVMGSQASSGYSGGQAQSTAEGAFNTQGILSSYMLGNKMFDLTNQLDQEKIQMAKAQEDAATSQGWASLGGAVAGQAGNLAKLALLF